jgi:hypothetical protein
MYDIPGTVCGSGMALSRKRILGRARGLVLVVDPFSFPSLASHAKLKGPALGPSPDSPVKVAAVLRDTIDPLMEKRPTDRLPTPLAVVITKADALPTDEHPFLKGLLPQSDTAFSEEQSQRCRAALEQLDRSGPQFVRALEQKFEKVAYFACTATGRLPVGGDRTPFQPRGVAEPFLWLLGLC